jgi:CheY-like chemotaxis protein
VHRQVLLVDDDPDIRFALKALLEDEGFEVRCAEDGRLALDELQRGALPCGIVLDLMMPKMSGWEFLLERRASPALAAIPVAVLTATEEAAFPSSALAEACLRKPVDVERLVAFLEGCSRAASGSGEAGPCAYAPDPGLPAPSVTA